MTNYRPVKSTKKIRPDPANSAHFTQNPDEQSPLYMIECHMSTDAPPRLQRIKATGRTFAQHIFITIEFFTRNGLANHAAAGAYGFLLSAVPMLLIVSLFLIRAFQDAPEAAVALLQSVPFLDIAFGEYWPALDFLLAAPPGIPALVSMVSVLWASRIFAVAMQRGLKIVFSGTKKRNSVKNQLVTLGIELLLLIIMLLIILSSRMALRLYDIAGFFANNFFMYFLASLFVTRLSQLAILGLVLYLAYRLIPANPPGKFAALCGSAFCVVIYGVAAIVLNILISQPRYNFLYGTLGNLIIGLVSVYFFFLFFFLGAQFAVVTHSFEALLFLRLREARIGTTEKGRRIARKIAKKLFASVNGRLKKYHRFYRTGEIIFSKGDACNEVHFLLEGEVEVLLPSPSLPQENCDSAAVLQPGIFLGEMGYLLSEGRTATIRAKTDASVMALPVHIFEAILGSDINLDRSIIENLSRRVKEGNDQLAALSGYSPSRHDSV